MHNLKRRLIITALAIVTTLTIGTVGFVVIEDGFSPFDAFYMSLITITTVGYAEVVGLSRAGRIFNSFLLLFGVGVMFYAIGVMTQTIIELELGEFFGKRRIRRMIEKLKDHYIICGFGRVGRAAAEELQRSSVPFVITDTDPKLVERAIKKGMLAVVADAKSDEALEELGILRAHGVIGALSTDADNVFLILSAKALNPNLQVSARVNEEESEAKLRTAGADAVFRPYSVTGYRLAQAILRPYVFEFLDFTSSTMEMGQNIELDQVEVGDGSALSGKSLKDMQLRRDHDLIVLAIRSSDGAMRFNPPADARSESGNHLIVMGTPEDIEILVERMKGVQV